MDFFQQDLNDAFNLMLWTMDNSEEYNPKDPEHVQLRKKWDRAVKLGEHFRLAPEEARNLYRHWDHGRRVAGKALEQPLIVGKTRDKYVILDGSHRLLSAIEKEKKFINIFLIDVSFCDSVDDMQ
jgi:hypothetical protein